jgi:hypothetical protein
MLQFNHFGHDILVVIGHFLKALDVLNRILRLTIGARIARRRQNIEDCPQLFGPSLALHLSQFLSMPPLFF